MEHKGTCPICYTDLEGERLVVLESCSHPFHLECFQMFLENKVKARHAEMICPLDGCRAPLSVNQVIKVLPTDLMEVFYEYTFDNMVAEQGLSYCPQVGCNYVFELNVTKEGSSFVCLKCFGSFCVSCRTESHEGRTCDEVREKSEEFKEVSVGLKELRCKMCPKCKHWVERN